MRILVLLLNNIAKHFVRAIATRNDAASVIGVSFTAKSPVRVCLSILVNNKTFVLKIRSFLIANAYSGDVSRA